MRPQDSTPLDLALAELAEGQFGTPTKASRSRRSHARCWTWARPSAATASSERSRRPSACSCTTTEPSATSSQDPPGTEEPDLPEPLVNSSLAAPAHPHIVPDFYWPTHRLIVETDGWETHRTRAAFEQDRARDAALTAAGWRVVRFTWHEPRETIQRRLQALLHH